MRTPAVTDRVEGDRALHRVDVLGVPFTCGAFDTVIDEIERWIIERRHSYVSFVAVHNLMEAQHSSSVMRALLDAGIAATDGMPIVWACRRAGVKGAERVYGPDAMLELCERAAQAGWSSYFYGGAPGVPELLAEKLEARFPGLPIAGMWSPPYRALTPVEDEEAVARVNAAKPDIVWVGLGTPKQDVWMAEHLGRIDAPVMLGVGAAFDFHAGTQRQAPVWMQRRGLEWLFRLASEPRRLAGRYLRANPAFVAKIARRPPRLLA